MTSQNTDQERELFEASGITERLWRSNTPGDTAYYEDSHTEMAWKAWQAARRAPVVLVPQGYKITEEQHVAAVKVLHRAAGVDDLPQRMLDAILAAAPQPQGWKLVPLDPTNGMVLSAAGICSDKNEQDSVKAAYYAMLAAAPQPPEVEIGKEQP